MVLVGRERLRGLILTAALRAVLKGAALDPLVIPVLVAPLGELWAIE